MCAEEILVIAVSIRQLLKTYNSKPLLQNNDQRLIIVNLYYRTDQYLYQSLFYLLNN